jgi:hypothetical protein
LEYFLMAEGFSAQAGFGISQRFPYTIPLGQATAVNAVLDLGRPYAFLILASPVAPTGAAAPSNTISIRLSDDIDGPLIPLGDDDGVPLAQQIGAVAVWRRYFVGAARRVQIVLSANVTGEVLFHVIGSDSGLR